MFECQCPDVMFDACYSNSRIHWQGCKCIPYTFSETIKARDGTKPPDLNIGQVLQLKTWTGVSDIPCDLSTGKRHTLRFCRNWMFARWFFLIQLYWMLGLTPSDRWGGRSFVSSFDDILDCPFMILRLEKPARISWGVDGLGIPQLFGIRGSTKSWMIFDSW